MASPASSDEGEIRDGSVEKATTMLPQLDGTSVDRPDRHRSSTSSSMSPAPSNRSRDPRSRDRSRSPYRADKAPRGSKRPRDEEFTDRSRGDIRRFKVHYEEPSHEYPHRSRASYQDLDRGPTASSSLRYDDQDRYSEKRHRTRSRSPYRANRGSDRDNRGERGNGQDRRYGGQGNDGRRLNAYGNGDMRSREHKDQSVSKRGLSPLPADNARREAKSVQGHSQRSIDHSQKDTETNK